MMWWGLLIFAVIIIVVSSLPFAKWKDWQCNYRQQKNVALYREQMSMNPSQELAQEFAERLLDDEKLLQNRLRFEQLSVHKSNMFFTKAMLLIVLCLLLLPALYYFSLDRYQAVQQGEQAFLQQQMRLMEQAMSQQNEDKILQIQQKLRQDPNHAENWFALGQAYMENNEFGHALIAYRNAEQLIGSQPYILGAIATAIYYQSNQQITLPIQELLQQALNQDPLDTASLSLIATNAFVEKNYQQAAKIWQKMLDSERSNLDRKTLIQRIQMAELLQQSK
ncbi:cytochrome c nitrite reductase, subunit NrfG [Pasteurella canis]|uniref:Cytochrome c nitrite reductase, subunit NrfG n=1 Tax=Pasteurella canis TaxID=753 RepID=A0A379EV79_9PAST|nr:c-type cytochrome biogenesis protein [Pasteurella canis]SUC10305.1 cytochrome c nitrite reductase, subunit NrfG [Pasteurella canis]